MTLFKNHFVTRLFCENDWDKHIITEVLGKLNCILVAFGGLARQRQFHHEIEQLQRSWRGFISNGTKTDKYGDNKVSFKKSIRLNGIESRRKLWVALKSNLVTFVWTNKGLSSFVGCRKC